MRKKILCAVWSAAFMVLCGTAARGATTTTSVRVEPQMKSYVQQPIFQSSAILPNIMIVLDHSGSMCYPAYPDPYVPDANSPNGDITNANYEGLNCRAITPVSDSTDDAAEPSPSGTCSLTTNPLYMSYGGSPAKEWIVGLRFKNVKVPKAVGGVPVTITRAYIRFVAQQDAAAAGASYTIAGQNHANPVTFANTATNKITGTGRTWLTPTVTWNAASTDAPLTAWLSGKKYDTTAVTAIVKKMVEENAGWASGNAMVFKITGSAGSKRYPWSYNGNSKYAPQLIIEYEPCSPKEYYGYFDPAARYVYNSAGPYFERTTLTGSTTWSGNFLNWLCMRRFDVLKKVLIGGKRNVGVDNDTILGEGLFNFTSGYTNTSAWWQTYYFDSSAASAPKVSPYPEAWYGVKGGFLLVQNTTPMDPSTAGFSTSSGTAWHTTATATFKIAVKKSRAAEPSDYCIDDNGIWNLCGVMQKIGTQAQWGNFWYYETVPVNAIGTNIPLIVRTIETKVSENSTPTANAIRDVTTYFKGATSKGDPFKDKSGNIIPCAKSYMLLLTDGEPNTEGDFPDYDGDGNDAGTSYRPYDAMDDLAFYAHTTDLRSGINGKQSIDAYVVYAFGKSSIAPVILRETAINGGFRDLDKDGKADGYGKHPTAGYGSNPTGLLTAFTQYSSDQRGEWDKDGDGVPDNYYEAQNGDEIEARVTAAINDILNQASSGTSVSVLATTGEGEGTLVQAIFLPSKVVGTQEVYWLGRVQSLWVDAKGNMREDTVNDKVLNVQEDYIISYFFDMENAQTMVKRYAVGAGNEYPDIFTASYQTIALEDVKPIWEGGAMLADRSADERTIYTSVTSLGGGGFFPFTTANAAVLRPFLGIEDTDFYSYLHATNPLYRAENLIEYTRGKDQSGTGAEALPHVDTATKMRSRTLDGKVWKLGDVVFSTPVSVSQPLEKYGLLYGDESYRAFKAKYADNSTTARQTMVYVGGNDGMLHAFTSGWFDKESNGFVPKNPDNGIGDELWAYIPQSLLPHLKWLASKSYALDTHVPFVDLKPKVVDVQIFPADAVHVGGWGTVLIGGLNFGGKHIWTNNADGTISYYDPSFFAIDITDPTNPKLLWDRSFTNLGLTINQTTLVKVREKWYLAIGSGPANYDVITGTFDISTTGRVYMVDILTGAEVKYFETTESKAYMVPPLAVDRNFDWSVDVLYAAANYIDTDGSLKGKVYRAGGPPSTKDNATYPAAWTMKALLQDSALRPITAQFVTSVDDRDNGWVYFGTGRFMIGSDKTSSVQNYLVGVKDPFFNRLGLSRSAATAAAVPCYHNATNTACALSFADLMDATPYEVKPNGIVVPQTGGDSTLITWDKLMAKVRSKNSAVPPVEIYKGWYRKLDTFTTNPSERVVNRPTIVRGVTVFPTYLPNQDTCGYGGISTGYALYYETGTAFKRATLIKLNGVAFDNTAYIQYKFDLGYGLSSTFGVHTGQEKEGHSTLYGQMSTGLINVLELAGAMSGKSGIGYWKEGR